MIAARRPATVQGLALASLALFAGCAATPDEEEVSMRSAVDGQFDASDYLATRTGFLPVPILITEPAVGYGGGLGAMFLSPKRPDENGVKPKGPPDITGVAGGYTESDTWFGGLFHFGSWKDDHWRYVGAIGTAHANVAFSGLGGGAAGTGGERELDYGIDAQFLRQELLAKVAETPLFVGLRYQIAKTEVHFDVGVPAVANTDFDRQDAALALVAQFDTRDTLFTPSRGTNTSIVGWHYDQSFGGDAAYNRIDFDAPFWIGLDPKLVLGVRPILEISDSDAPFYSLPYVQLRGVPALRYQGQDAASIEAELRWNFVRRWSVVGFGGFGQAVNDLSDFGGEAYTVGAGGFGFRYMLAEKFGLHVGIDVAHGPEDGAIYLQVGNAWR